MVSFRFRRTEVDSEKSTLGHIVDAQRARAWLATVAPLESGNNLHLVAELIGELMDGNLSPERKFEVLEPVRASLSSVLVERVRSIEYRSVPLSSIDGDLLWSLIDTVEDLREAYEMLITRLGDTPPSNELEGLRPGDSAVKAPSRVMTLARALDLNAQVLLFYQRMRVAVPERLWDQHCRLAQLARQLKCHGDVIDDPLRAALTETPRSAFTIPVLVALADPTAQTPQEFQALVNCAVRWAGKVGFRIDSTLEQGALAARPANNPGPVVSLAGNQHLVRLDTQKLLRSVSRRLTYLEEGKTPQSIGLGDAISVTAARQLLVNLQRYWGAVSPESIEFPEQNWRPSAAEFALAVVGLSSPPERSASDGSLSGTAYQYMRLRDDAVTKDLDALARDRLNHLLAEAETWSVIGETPDSLLCLRRHPRPGLSLGHLIGIKLGGKAGPVPFLLGAVQGLQQAINEDPEGLPRPASSHLVRVRLLPGLPQVAKAAVDQVELDGVFIMLPLSDASAGMKDLWDRVRLSADAFSLVTPPGTYRPARIVRVVAGGLAAVVRLSELLHRGLDFEQVSFTMV